MVTAVRVARWVVRVVSVGGVVRTIRVVMAAMVIR